jgi:group I intron endonuclease
VKQAGVYTITNLVTGRCYVGSSSHVPQRWRDHLSKLNNGKHCNADLLSDWQQYGAKSFSWIQVEKSDSRQEAIGLEQRLIDATANLYNAARRAGSGPRDGFKHSEESRLKMSQSQKGQPKSAAHRSKLSAAKAGKKCPAHSAILTGRKHSPEHCAAISRANTGKRHTEEHKSRMRALMTGRDTSAWVSKMAASKRGVPWSIDKWHSYALKHYA